MKRIKRAKRREQTKRIKEKAKKIIKNRKLNTDPNQTISPKEIGKVAAVHGAECSCMMCGNPRKKWNKITLQEIKQNIKDQSNT